MGFGVSLPGPHFGVRSRRGTNGRGAGGIAVLSVVRAIMTA
jgi:hypothetical protein